MKLVKIQREMLETAIQSERAHGIRKPITVFAHYRGKDLTGYSKNWANYIKKMWILMDEGLLALDTSTRDTTHAYVVDLEKAEQFLKSH